MEIADLIEFARQGNLEALERKLWSFKLDALFDLYLDLKRLNLDQAAKLVEDHVVNNCTHPRTQK